MSGWWRRPWSPWSGASPTGWQFTQRGLCNTTRTVSNAASGSRTGAAGAAAVCGGGAAWEQARSGRANSQGFIAGSSGELQRQGAQPLLGQRIDGVGYRSGDGGGGWLPDPPHLRVALDDVDVDLRHLRHPQHAIVVEVALLDAAVLERDRAV